MDFVNQSFHVQNSWEKYFTSENNVVFLQHSPVPTITQTLITIFAFVRMHSNLGVPVVQNHIIIFEVSQASAD